jgi:hypothetical protein
MLELLDLEQERQAGVDHYSCLSQLLSSGDLTVLEWVDEHYGTRLRSEHFYHASQRWTWYCLERDRHLSLVLEHAWHLLPPLLGKRALYHLLWFGIAPPQYDSYQMATTLLQFYFATKPSAAEITCALVVAPNEETAGLLRAYTP